MSEKIEMGTAVPQYVPGELRTDDRGKLAFVNDFNLTDVKRFYTVSNHKAGFVRAWHAHRREEKFVTALKGEAVIGAVKIDDWDNPSQNTEVHRYVLSSSSPAVIYIPAGYANGSMSLTNDTLLGFFSTASLQQSLDDDVRYEPRHWDIWTVAER